MHHIHAIISPLASNKEQTGCVAVLAGNVHYLLPQIIHACLLAMINICINSPISLHMLCINLNYREKAPINLGFRSLITERAHHGKTLPSSRKQQGADRLRGRTCSQRSLSPSTNNICMSPAMINIYINSPISLHMLCINLNYREKVAINLRFRSPITEHIRPLIGR